MNFSEAWKLIRASPRRALLYYRDEATLEELQAASKVCRGAFGMRCNRSIWFCGESQEAFLAADLLIVALKRHAPESRFIMMSDSPEVERWLKLRYRDDSALPLPLPDKKSCKRFVKQLDPKLIVLLQSPGGFSPAMRDIAKKNEIPLILVDGEGEFHRTIFEKPLFWPFSALCVYNQAGVDHFAKAGMSVDRIKVTGSLGFETAAIQSSASPGYLRRELGIEEGDRFLVMMGASVREERYFLKLVSSLTTLPGRVCCLWKPVSKKQLARLERALERRGVPYRRWNERKEAEASVLFLEPQESAAPFYSAALAVIAGGCFTRFRFTGKFVLPLTAESPVIIGPFLPKSAVQARQLAGASAVVQCGLSKLWTTLLPFIEDEANAESVKKAAREIMEGAIGAANRSIELIAPLYEPLPDERRGGHRWKIRKAGKGGEGKVDPTESLLKVELEGWDAFRRRLGSHSSILCLGNGPSSESSEVIAAAHDCLFRVNWRWRDRGILTAPKAVFVGTAATIGELDLPCIFMFSKAEVARSALISSQVLPRKALIEYFTVERNISPWVDNLLDSDLARPSNGAAMIVAAVALKPDRLTIAGIDLFAHSDGRYPGDFQGVNCYSISHDPNCEIGIIERALREYQGELTILSPVLREALLRRGFDARRLSVASV